MSDKTFTMIKPDAIEANNHGLILEKILASGFKIIAMKMILLSNYQAKQFYKIHEGKPFFQDLIDFITRGPVIVAVLNKENAVKDFRNLIGTTDPIKAEKGTIRKLFAKSVGENAIHGSDSDDNAKIESSFHFSTKEIFSEI
tara:strand:- start:46517 stop:46942 length:426 start_codon:yes stop_codon:yes gene_type:complete